MPGPVLRSWIEAAISLVDAPSRCHDRQRAGHAQGTLEPREHPGVGYQAVSNRQRPKDGTGKAQVGDHHPHLGASGGVTGRTAWVGTCSAISEEFPSTLCLSLLVCKMGLKAVPSPGGCRRGMSCPHKGLAQQLVPSNLKNIYIRHHLWSGDVTCGQETQPVAAPHRAGARSQPFWLGSRC